MNTAELIKQPPAPNAGNVRSATPAVRAPDSERPTGEIVGLVYVASFAPESGESANTLAAPAGERPLWKEVPSWFLIAEEDRNIPSALQRLMAERAGAHSAVEIPGASHAAAVSHPDATAQLILEAAASRVTA